MNTLIHPVAPEDVMALMDGELTAGEATVISQHVEQCAECAMLRDQLRSTSHSLSSWTVPPVPPSLEQRIKSGLTERTRNPRSLRIRNGFTFRSWRLWAVAGGGGAVFGALALLVFAPSIFYYGEHAKTAPMRQMTSTSDFADFPRVSREAGVAGNGSLGKLEVSPSQASAPTAAPLIARAASLTVLVKNVDTARRSLDEILTHHHGYSAQLTITETTPPRSLTSSLRIPVAELEVAIAEMRALGIVERESQSGEEVTQQHTDLAARLANARETEAQMRDILAHRTGKMQDVLDVADKISETRGEIELLEAEQKNLEHRVEFASVDLELAEQYEAQLGNRPGSIANQVRNSFIAGLRHAGDSLLGLVLLGEEYGPVMLVWLALLGVPGILLWGRYRRVRNAIGK